MNEDQSHYTGLRCGSQQTVYRLLFRPFLRLSAMRFMFSANTARFFALPPLRFPAAIFAAVARPNLPSVPFRFISERASCIHFAMCEAPYENDTTVCFPINR